MDDIGVALHKTSTFNPGARAVNLAAHPKRREPGLRSTEGLSGKFTNRGTSRDRGAPKNR